MSFSFRTIPLDIRTPGTFVEVDGSRASRGLANPAKRILVIGHRLSTATVSALTPTVVRSSGDAVAVGGARSQLAAMLDALRSVNRFAEIVAVGVAEPSGGTKATSTLTYTGTATENGESVVYVGFRRVAVSVSVGDTAAVVAAAMQAALAAVPRLQVTAAVSSGVVTLSAAWKGETGNSIDVRANYREGEKTPAGLGLAIVAMASGAGVVDITTAFAVIGDDWYTTVIQPWTDSTALTALATEMERRWEGTVQLESLAYTGFAGTVGAMTTFGTGQNQKLICAIGTGKSPTTPWEGAAIVAGLDVLEDDAAAPRTSLLMTGFGAPAIADRPTREERDTLLHSGISTFTVDETGACRIERLITMYRTNDQSIADTAFLDVTTIRTLQALRYSLRVYIATKFARFKLADDGAPVAPGQRICTPKSIRAAVLTWFTLEQARGLVENYTQFSKELIVERDANDQNRVNAIVPPDLINQLLVTALQIQFL